MRTYQPKRTRTPTDRNAAEAIGVEALTYLASDAHELEQFMATTGVTPLNLRDAAAEPHFLAGVLDHIMSNEPLLLACASNLGRHPEEIAAAALMLAGPHRPIAD
jgi:hypothetical protein